MWRIFWIIVMVFALSLGPSQMPAGAGCEQAELEGTWSIDVDFSATNCLGDYSLHCFQVQIDANGVIQNTGATILSDCESWTITGGQLNLLPTCVIEGYIQTSRGTLSVERGGTNGENTLVLATPPE